MTKLTETDRDELVEAIRAQPVAKDIDIASGWMYENPDCGASLKTVILAISRFRKAHGIDRNAILKDRFAAALEADPTASDLQIIREVTGGRRSGVKILSTVRQELGYLNTFERCERRRDAVADIVNGQEYEITVRQAFYLCVAAGVIEKAENEYNNIQGDLQILRANGRVPWHMIEDRTRVVRFPKRETWLTVKPDDWELEREIESQNYQIPTYTAEFIVSRRADDVFEDLSCVHNGGVFWEWIDRRPVILVEKDALHPTVERIAEPFRTPAISTRGFSSWTQIRNVALSMENDDEGKAHEILMLCDCDTSGVHMEDSFKRLLKSIGDSSVPMRKLALTPDQIEEWNIPTRPDKGGKVKDGLAAELDAIPPETFRTLIENGIREYIPADHFQRVRDYARSTNTELRQLIDENLFDADGQLTDYARSLVERDN